MNIAGKHLLLVLVAGSVSFSMPALAHHSFAMFDQTKPTTLKGATVTRFEWANPHVFLVVKDKGKIYTLECSSPNLMGHQGWKFNTLKPGEQVNITYYPLRNGKAGGMLKTVMTPTGKTLKAW